MPLSAWPVLQHVACLSTLTLSKYSVARSPFFTEINLEVLPQ